MPETHEARVSLPQKELEYLESIARARQLTVAQLIQELIREHYLSQVSAGSESLEEIFSMALPVEEWGDWDSLEEDLESAHSAGLP